MVYMVFDLGAVNCIPIPSVKQGGGGGGVGGGGGGECGVGGEGRKNISHTDIIILKCVECIVIYIHKLKN